MYIRSEVKQLFELRDSLIGVQYSVTNRPRVRKDLIVVSTLEGLVAEEVNCAVVDAARDLLLVLDVIESISLVPALGKAVERDLSADGVPVMSARVVQCRVWHLR